MISPPRPPGGSLRSDFAPEMMRHLPSEGWAGHTRVMPELPEVEGLARFLSTECAGRRIDRFVVGSIAALRTVTPPFTDLEGRRVESVTRHGKFVDVEAEGLHLVFHLAKAGWLRWYAEVPQTVLKPGSYIAARLTLDSGAGFDLTEAGKRKGLAVYVVGDIQDVPGVARLGPDPLDPSFDQSALAGLLDGSRSRIKNLLRDQSVLAGVGNADSDEILHAAKLSPFAIAQHLDDEEVRRLFEALTEVLREAPTRPPRQGRIVTDRRASAHTAHRLARRLSRQHRTRTSEPPTGIEPATCCLQDSCSTD